MIDLNEFSRNVAFFMSRFLELKNRELLLKERELDLQEKGFFFSSQEGSPNPSEGGVIHAEVVEEGQDPSKWSREALKAFLDQKGIEYSERQRTNTLVELACAAMRPPELPEATPSSEEPEERESVEPETEPSETELETEPSETELEDLDFLDDSLEKEAEEPLTQEDVTAILKDVAVRKSSQDARALLKKFGASRVSEIAEEDYVKVVVEANEVLAEKDAS